MNVQRKHRIQNSSKRTIFNAIKRKTIENSTPLTRTQYILSVERTHLDVCICAIGFFFYKESVLCVQQYTRHAHSDKDGGERRLAYHRIFIYSNWMSTVVEFWRVQSSTSSSNGSSSGVVHLFKSDTAEYVYWKDSHIFQCISCFSMPLPLPLSLSSLSSLYSSMLFTHSLVLVFSSPMRWNFDEQHFWRTYTHTLRITLLESPSIALISLLQLLQIQTLVVNVRIHKTLSILLFNFHKLSSRVRPFAHNCWLITKRLGNFDNTVLLRA